METPSCWGGKGPAASGTDTPGTPPTCTCFHLVASTLNKIRKSASKLMQSRKNKQIMDKSCIKIAAKLTSATQMKKI